MLVEVVLGMLVLEVVVLEEEEVVVVDGSVVDVDVVVGFTASAAVSTCDRLVFQTS